MADTKYLIIGNSAAGIGCVEGIRRHDRDGSITLLSRESEAAYSRPLITYLLGGKVDEAGMSYRPESFYKKYKVDARLGVTATGLDAEAKTVTTGDGETISFDKLLIATGGRPIVPPDLKGADAEGVFTFTTWADSRAIKQYLEENKVTEVVVVGGGLIGLKSVEALVALGVKTTVVELADRVLAVTLDHTASSLASAALERAGVTLLTNVTLKSIQAKAGKVSGATLSDGGKLTCGMVIMAIGVVPDLGLVQGAGLDTDRGILAGDDMATSRPDIYAAGDVAQATEIISGQKRSIPIWPLAYRQGFVAGSNMAGRPETYRGGLAMNAVEICGLATISAGTTTPPSEASEVLTSLDEKAPAYRKLVLDQGRLVGYVLVGDVDRAGILTGLIQSGIEVTAFKDQLLSDGFGLISLPDHYRQQVVAGQGVPA